MYNDIQHIRKDLESPAKTLVSGDSLINLSNRLNSNVTSSTEKNGIIETIDKIKHKMD